MLFVEKVTGIKIGGKIPGKTEKDLHREYNEKIYKTIQDLSNIAKEELLNLESGEEEESVKIVTLAIELKNKIGPEITRLKEVKNLNDELKKNREELITLERTLKMNSEELKKKKVELDSNISYFNKKIETKIENFKQFAKDGEKIATNIKENNLRDELKNVIEIIEKINKINHHIADLIEALSSTIGRKADSVKQAMGIITEMKGIEER